MICYTHFSSAAELTFQSRITTETTWNSLPLFTSGKQHEQDYTKGETERHKCKPFLNTYLCHGLFCLCFTGFWRPASSRRRPRTGALCTSALKHQKENSCALDLVEMKCSNCAVPFYEKTELMSVRKLVYFL